MNKGIVGCVLVALVVGCSGGTTGVGSSGSSGGSSSGGSSGASSSSSSSGSSGGSCTTGVFDGNRACVPGTAKSGTTLSIQAEGKGCAGCGTTLGKCEVEVKGTTIKVSIDKTECQLPPETTCDLSCQVPRVTCQIPPLAAGSYQIMLDASAQVEDPPPRTLVVKDGASATSCSFDAPISTTIDSRDYPHTCTIDDDCKLVEDGNLCVGCGCADKAISASAFDGYESDVRTRQSACETNGGGADCAQCAARVAKCSQGSCIAAIN